MKSPKPINKFFAQKNPQLAGLVTQARQLQKLSACLLDLIPIPLNLHFQVAGIQNNTLVLIAESSVWSARLRYSIPELINKLKHHPQISTAIQSIEIKVDPDWRSLTPAKPQQGKTLSKNAVDCLTRTAASIEIGPVKSALLRLASHTQK